MVGGDTTRYPRSFGFAYWAGVLLIGSGNKFMAGNVGWKDIQFVIARNFNSY